MTARQRRGQRRVQCERRGRLPVQELIEDRCRRVACERCSSGRHLEQHDSQREEIRARIERLAERLFRRHVADRADRASRRWMTRQPSWSSLRIPRRDRLEELRHSEVENLDAIVVGNHDVAGLQVAVQDSRGVSTRKPLGHLRREGERFRERERSAGAQELAQAPALNELHRDEDQTVSLLHRVEVHDVGMIEGGRGPGFALEQRETIDAMRRRRDEEA